MGIRTYKKDHVRELAPPLAATQSQHGASDVSASDPLRFWTCHPSDKVLIDLHVFKNGQLSSPLKNPPSWAGPFTGRPRLILQLAPAIQAICDQVTQKTATSYFHSLRLWWRILDAVEATADATGRPIKRVETVADLTELHRQYAMDKAVDRVRFNSFLRIVNLVRRAKGLSPLYWTSPEDANPTRLLPPKWQVDCVRFKLKHEWFATLARWERADELLGGCEPKDENEVRLQKNYLHFKLIAERTSKPVPTASELWGEQPTHAFYSSGYRAIDMIQGFYPDVNDIRAAFHLCLANTGWNPAVLISLRVDDEFLSTHPKDPTRYLLRGFKVRGKSELVTEGLYKSRGSPGVILQTLMQRTAGLREELRNELLHLKAEYDTLKLGGKGAEELDKKLAKIVRLEKGTQSPWLHVNRGKEIVWLDERYRAGKQGDSGAGSYLDVLIKEINRSQSPDKQVSPMTASDFRDAFAAYAFQISGGLVLYVMKALGHKKVKTTKTYLDNTLLNSESKHLYRTFSNALWHEIKVHGRMDPTIIAKWSRDGDVNEIERERLHVYRSLRRSRLGIACKNPHNPPKRVAPHFQPNGASLCPIHRCTLCMEHAVILPESLEGLCMRLIELRVIRSSMSLVAFVESSFAEEMTNTEAALACFDELQVQNSLTIWQQRVESGGHRVIDFDGA